MKTNHNLNLTVLLAAAVLTVGTMGLLGADSLSLIPTLTGDTSNSGRAITPDGRYIVGVSGSSGFLYAVGSAAAINVLSSDGAQASQATGVGYRTSGGNTELIISGLSSGYVTEWMTSDGGATFGPKRRNTSFTSNVQPSYNSLGAGIGSDAYYVSSWINGNGQTVYLGQGTGPWVATVTYQGKGITSTDTSRMNGVSASGRAVGYRVNGGIRKNYMLTWTGTTPAAVYFNGLDGTQAGEAFSVSANGNTIFGRSPILNNATLFGYKVVNPGASQSIAQLPLFGDESGTAFQAPYGCTADGGIAVGMDYRGVERAALWVTFDPNPANWFVLDLTAVAQAEGILGDFTRLTRAYSVAYDAMGDYVITGEGILADGSTRAWVMTVVPEPTMVSLLGLGGLFALVLRRRN